MLFFYSFPNQCLTEGVLAISLKGQRSASGRLQGHSDMLVIYSTWWLSPSKTPRKIHISDKNHKKSIRKINVFKLRLSWLALAPQVGPKGHFEAHFETLKLTLWTSLPHSLALSGPLWLTHSLSGALWLTLWLSLAHILAHSVAHSGSLGSSL